MSNEKSKFDEGYEAGFEAGKSLRLEVIELKARHAYLKAGGEWHKYNYEPDGHLAGFEDAMETLGLKP